jgi:phosphate transport system permease protein
VKRSTLKEMKAASWQARPFRFNAAPHLFPFSRKTKDRLAQRVYFAITLLPVILLAAITLGLALRSLPIFQAHSLGELLGGRIWQPSRGNFGFLPFIAGTFWVTVTAMLLAVPPCLFTAIYLVEYAHKRTRQIIKPLLDLLSGIPSVVYGVWGVIAIVPAVQSFSAWASRNLGFLPIFRSANPTGYSILAGGVVLAVMVAPFVIAVTFEVMMAVPRGLREASLAVGATRWQTVKHAVLPRCLPGIVAGIVLGASRALGETMAVLMVVGNVVKMPASIFDAAYPLTALIANNYGEMMSVPLYDAALLSAALVLLVVVMVFNVLSTLVLRHIIGRAWV